MLQLFACISRLRTRFDDEQGQALVEYSFLVSLLAITAVLGLLMAGQAVGGEIRELTDALLVDFGENALFG